MTEELVSRARGNATDFALTALMGDEIRSCDRRQVDDSGAARIERLLVVPEGVGLIERSTLKHSVDIVGALRGSDTLCSLLTNLTRPVVPEKNKPLPHRRSNWLPAWPPRPTAVESVPSTGNSNDWSAFVATDNERTSAIEADYESNRPVDSADILVKVAAGVSLVAGALLLWVCSAA